jgi:hypothetical protein
MRPLVVAVQLLHNNIGIVFEQEFANLCTKKIGIAIGSKTPGKQACVPAEEEKC